MSPARTPIAPGMHATDTLDFMTVLDGEIVLGLDDGEHRLTQGDSVIQRGNVHRWRVVGDQPCVYAVVMLRPDASSGSAPLEVETPSAGTTARGVASSPAPTATADPAPIVDGPASVVYEPGGAGGVSLVELWQTGGPPREPRSGW